MTIDFKSVVNCNILRLQESFQGSYFGYAFSKACQYATTNEKVCKGLKYESIKTTQYDLQKCITQLKQSSKSRQEQNKACVDLNFPKRKLKTLVKKGNTLFQL